MFPSRISSRPASLASWLREGELHGAELLAGLLCYRPVLRPRAAALRERLLLRLTEVHGAAWAFHAGAHVQLGENGVRPHLVGWLRERVDLDELPRPVLVRPDWIGELVNPEEGPARAEERRAIYHRAEVPHLWLIERGGAAQAFRWAPAGYEAGAAADLPPFDIDPASLDSYNPMIIIPSLESL